MTSDTAATGQGPRAASAGPTSSPACSPSTSPSAGDAANRAWRERDGRRGPQRTVGRVAQRVIQRAGSSLVAAARASKPPSSGESAVRFDGHAKGAAGAASPSTGSMRFPWAAARRTASSSAAPRSAPAFDGRGAIPRDSRYQSPGRPPRTVPATATGRLDYRGRPSHSLYRITPVVAKSPARERRLATGRSRRPSRACRRDATAPMLPAVPCEDRPPSHQGGRETATADLGRAL